MTRQELIVKAIRKTFEAAAVFEKDGYKFNVDAVDTVTVSMWDLDTQGQRKNIRACLSYTVNQGHGMGPHDHVFPRIYQVEKLEQEDESKRS